MTFCIMDIFRSNKDNIHIMQNSYFCEWVNAMHELVPHFVILKEDFRQQQSFAVFVTGYVMLLKGKELLDELRLSRFGHFIIIKTALKVSRTELRTDKTTK